MCLFRNKINGSSQNDYASYKLIQTVMRYGLAAWMVIWFSACGRHSDPDLTIVHPTIPFTFPPATASPQLTAPVTHPPPTSTPVPSFTPSFPVPVPSATSRAVPWTMEIRYAPYEFVLAVDWSEDGKYLAVAAGKEVHIYQADSLHEVRSLSIGSWVNSLAFRPLEGQDEFQYLLALGVQDGSIQLWDILAGERLVSQLAHGKEVKSVAFDLLGDFLVSSGSSPFVRLWDVKRLLSQVTTDQALIAEFLGSALVVPGVGFSPDGEWLATIDGNAVRLRDGQTNLLQHTLRAEQSVLSLAFSPDSQVLAVGEMGNNLHLWDVESGEFLGVLPQTGGSPQDFYWDLDYSPDGVFLAAGSSDGWIRLWLVATGQVKASWIAHPHGVAAISFSPDGKRLVSGGLDGTIRLWLIPPNR
jgi:WD40 repeat protein